MKKVFLLAAAALILTASNAVSQGVYEGRIEGEFKGWEGETIYKLADGHIIQQSAYYYHYHYAYSPKVIIYKTSRGFMIKVDGSAGNDVPIIVLK